MSISYNAGSISKPSGSISNEGGTISEPSTGTITTSGDTEAGTYLLWSVGNALLWAAGDNRIQYKEE